MDLKELGSRLKAERQRQGLTIEQIMEITKISRVNIDAIENGDRNEFPHEVYAKGFIKNYAKALGLDSEEIGEEFSKLMSASEDSEPEVEDVFKADQPQQQIIVAEKGRSSSFGVILLILLLVVVVGGLVYYLHDKSIINFGNGKQAELVDQQISTEEENTLAEIVEDTDEALENNSASQPGVEEDEAIEQTPEQQPENVEEQDEQLIEESSSAPVEEVVAQVSPRLVEVTAKPGEACWIETIVDGKRSEYVLQEGDTLSLPYEDTLIIKLGNAGGVEMKSGGKPFEFDASKGKVLTFEFPVS